MKQRKFILFLIITLLVGSTGDSYAWGRKKKKMKNQPTMSMPVPKKLSPYERLFDGKKCETAKGFLTLHKIDGKIYVELPLKYMERDMLIGSTVSEISDNRFALVGEKPHIPLHAMFVLKDSSVNLLHRDNCHYLTTDKNIEERLKVSMKSPLVERFKVEAWTPDSTAVIFDMTGFLLSDNEQFDPFSPFSVASGMGQRQIDKSFNRDKSMIAGIKAFSDNVSIQSLLSYMAGVRGPDPRSPRAFITKSPFTALMTRSIILLPEETMSPRLGDPRINVFVDQMVSFDNKKGMEPVFYATRWKLEPKDQEAYDRGELVEPKKPIVFYVDDAFPENWKGYVKEGVEVWQKAFEKIGFKNAILAKDFPKDDPEFDPDNLKYSCVRYCPVAVPNAMGMSWKDPRTAEIINSTVYVYHNVVEMLQSWRFIQTSPADPEMRSVNMKEELLGDCLSYVIAHEVGHTLGFMHNMAASAAIPVDSLRSPSFTQKYGTTYSIMDYARNNYVAQPGDKEKGVRLTPPELGLYDYYAVKWLYTPLPEAKTPEEAQKIASKWITEKSGDPIYRYGKQQIEFRIDPSSIEEDLGDDAIKAAEYGVKNLKYIMTHLDEWVGKEDTDYSFRKRIYNEILFQYSRYLTQVLANIGGIYVNERYDGDLRLAYQVLPSEKQKRAVRFMFAQLKDLEWLNSDKLQRGFPLSGNVSVELISSIFKGLVERVEPIRICEGRTEKGGYTSLQYLDDLYRFIWGPTEQGRSLTKTEEKLQNEHLKVLIAGAGIEKKGITGVNMSGLVGYSGTIVPDFVKAGSREDYGDISENMSGIFNNRDYAAGDKVCIGAEHMGFGENGVRSNGGALDFRLLHTLNRVRKLVMSKAAMGSEDTRQHYQLLLFKIEKALKN